MGFRRWADRCATGADLHNGTSEAAGAVITPQIQPSTRRWATNPQGIQWVAGVPCRVPPPFSRQCQSNTVNPGVRTRLRPWRLFPPSGRPSPNHLAQPDHHRKPQQNKGWHGSGVLSATLRLAATPAPLRSLVRARRPRSSGPGPGDPDAASRIDARPERETPHAAGRLDQPPRPCAGTRPFGRHPARWEAMRTGPPCVRAGRKVYYRRAAVEEWLEEQEQAAPRRRRAGGRR